MNTAEHRPQKSKTYTLITTHPDLDRPNEFVLDHKVERFVACRIAYGHPRPIVGRSGLTIDEVMTETGYTAAELDL
jgi:hypothetical protein